ncbi:MAG: peptide chain release factor N(5)-glutamine methyltransferase [Mycoplasmataceae bacterium]|nr:peptide chain release factor N(5)-glutamine methyltransferase [Mycoplasmataceae bacterium]
MVTFSILYSLSKIVKNKNDFVKNAQSEIDFSKEEFFDLLNDYYKENKPLDHIIHQTKFCNIVLHVRDGVLTPRPETEELCYKVINILIKLKKPLSGADLCCGTGCIACAICANVLHAHVDCIDIDNNAIENTKENIELTGFNISAYQGDFYNTIIENNKKYDFIVCNPPYLSETELDKRMMQYESKIAFNNSNDPLYFHKKIIDNYKLIMNDKFLIAFEFGNTQKDELEEYLKKSDLKDCYEFYKDINNKDRMLIIKKL